jgi:hypothetical protein
MGSAPPQLDMLSLKDHVDFAVNDDGDSGSEIVGGNRHLSALLH